MHDLAISIVAGHSVDDADEVNIEFGRGNKLLVGFLDSKMCDLFFALQSR